MVYATETEFVEQFRPLSDIEAARLPSLLRLASRLIDRRVRIDTSDPEVLADARTVVLSMVAGCFPATPGTEGLRSWTKAVGERSESATASDEALGITSPVLLPWHLELLGASLAASPRFRFPSPARYSWWP